MAKRATAGKTELNITQEVRSLVEANKEIKGAEVMAALREKFPKSNLNENSCLDAAIAVALRVGSSALNYYPTFASSFQRGQNSGITVSR